MHRTQEDTTLSRMDARHERLAATLLTPSWTARLTTSRRPYRLVTFVTLFAMLFAGFFALPSAATAAGDQTINEVNFRIGPGTDYDVMSVIPAGTAIDVLAGPENGFYYIRYGDATGYASSEFLSIAGQNPDGGGVDTGGPTGAAWVIDGALNLRTEPSSSGTVILVLPGEAQVELTGERANGFVGVIYNGSTGWAFGDYIVQSAPVPTEEPVTPEPTEIPVTPEPTDVPVTPDPTEIPVTPEPTTPGEPTPPPSDGSWTEDEIIQIIYDAADRYGQPREDMLRVARCESLLDPGLLDDGGYEASGLSQFLPSTWATTPYADQDIFDPWASANAAGWMWSVGRRNEWVCQ